MERLFIYGTLAPGRPNHHRVADIPGEWRAATLRGTLHDEGWGATQGYPAIIPDPTGQAVQGSVLSSTELSEHWARLDAFEGEAYERVEVQIEFVEGGRADAFVYALRARDEVTS